MLSILPSELIWMIVGLGQLDLQDLVALSLTCRHLKRALFDRPPWISVGKRMQEQDFALPIPTFRTLETLSLQELKDTCIKAKQTKENLHSTLPNFRKHSKMSFDEGASILTSGFLPGGRYLLTFSDQKVAQLWDLDPLLVPSKYSEGFMLAVTRPVASHSTQVDPVTCNFQTHEQREGETIVAGTVESPSGLSIHVFAFIFEAGEGHGVLTKDLCITPPLHRMDCPTLSIYGDVAVAIGSSNETACLTVVLLDFRRQAIYVIDSGIQYHEQMNFEAFVHESDLIIYTPTPESVVIHAWFYAIGLLNSPSATSWSAIHTHPVPPDSTKVWQFEKRCQFPECDWWYPSRPWNTPNPRTRGLIPSHLTADWVADMSPLTTEEFLTGQSVSYPFLAPYWLDPAKVVRLMREEGPLPPAYRPTLRLRMTSFWPPLDEAFPLMTPSSCGQHMVWVASGEAQSDESDYPDLQLIRFPNEKDHSNRTGVVPYSRRLVLPLDLKKLHRVDFCDEAGVLAVICLGDVPSSPQMLHLFQY